MRPRLRHVAGWLRGWVAPRPGRWRWALLRVGVVVCFFIPLRFHAFAWLVAGHNLAWKAWTESRYNHPGDIGLLARLRGPGARMLVAIGEASALAQARDSAMIPVLLDMARTHPDRRVRAYAIEGLSQFADERIMPLATDALSDPDTIVRLAAARLFSELGDERHVSTLKAAAQAERDRHVRHMLERAIAEAEPAQTPAPGRSVKVAAIQFMSHFGQPALNRSRLETFVRAAARDGA